MLPRFARRRLLPAPVLLACAAVASAVPGTALPAAPPTTGRGARLSRPGRDGRSRGAHARGDDLVRLPAPPRAARSSSPSTRPSPSPPATRRRAKCPVSRARRGRRSHRAGTGPRETVRVALRPGENTLSLSYEARRLRPVRGEGSSTPRLPADRGRIAPRASTSRGAAPGIPLRPRLVEFTLEAAQPEGWHLVSQGSGTSRGPMGGRVGLAGADRRDLPGRGAAAPVPRPRQQRRGARLTCTSRTRRWRPGTWRRPRSNIEMYSPADRPVPLREVRGSSRTSGRRATACRASRCSVPR